MSLFTVHTCVGWCLRALGAYVSVCVCCWFFHHHLFSHVQALDQMYVFKRMININHIRYTRLQAKTANLMWLCLKWNEKNIHDICYTQTNTLTLTLNQCGQSIVNTNTAHEFVLCVCVHWNFAEHKMQNWNNKHTHTHNLSHLYRYLFTITDIVFAGGDAVAVAYCQYKWTPNAHTKQQWL